MAEIKLIIKTYNKKIEDEVKLKQVEQEARLHQIYTQASLTAQFIWTLYGGKPLPEFGAVFQGVSQTQPEEELINGLTRAEYNRAMLYKEQMIDYAHQMKKQKKGR